MRLKKQKPMKRGAGVLLPVSSLPSPYGIGTFGKDAFDFVDFLKSAGQKYWQVLPLSPTSFGDSPYQSFSAFAGNPYFIDPDKLINEGLLEKSRVKNIVWGDPHEVDYDLLNKERFPLLRKAFERSKHKDTLNYLEFCNENEYWLNDYSLYMAVKDYFGGLEWHNWPEGIRRREPDSIREIKKLLEKDIDFWKFCQYEFYAQWIDLKNYANNKGIEIIGDIPIYVAMDSADVWVNSRLFDMDENLRPNNVAGVPPDLFSETGQFWGNPLYNWEQMEKEGYSWWKARIEISAKIFDVIRIDHFIGIVNYYSIPSGATTAKNGVWLKGPGEKLVNAINSTIGRKKIIAEDLGVVTPKVRELVNKTGYPGMKLMQMAFDSGNGNENLPFHFDKNCVAYAGTHDNETLAGFFSHQKRATLKYAREYLHIKTNKKIPWAIIYAGYQSTANTVIFLMQDFLGLGNEARINTPSTVGDNWKWRITKNQITNELAAKLKKMTIIYGRQ